MTEARHVIRVPNWVWEWAQQKTGKSRPSSFLGDLLSQAAMANQVFTTTKATAAAANPETVVQQGDRGHAIDVARATLCDWPDCGLVIAVGERAVIRTNDETGWKEMFHIDHFRERAQSS